MEEFSMPQSILQIVSEKGFDGLREIMQMLFNEAMKMERENYLHASPYQRTDLRTDHANGFKPRTINTLQGEIQLSIPQARNGGFYPSCLEKGMHSERAINAAMTEMYIHGVAPREVTAILEKMCGLEVSVRQVSRATEMLDAEFKKWREQSLPEPIKYLLLDARYEKVRREDNTVVDCALLIAYGITESGRRCVLGVSVEHSEAEVHWRKFLESLITRGLHGLKLIVSDNHVGLKAARKSVFPFRDSDVSFIFCRMPLRISPGKVCIRMCTTTFATCSICRHGPMLKSC